MKVRFRPRFALSPVMLAFWVAASRVRENDHHPADVVTGGCIGSAWAPWAGSDFFRPKSSHLGRRTKQQQPTSNKLEPAMATRTARTAALQSNAQTPPPPPSPPPRQLGLLFRLASCTAKQPSATTTTTVAETFLCFLGSRIVAKRPDIARVF